MEKTQFATAPGTKPVNSGTVRNGKLDEALDYFRALPIDEKSGMMAFQFETGGFTIAFKRGDSMTHVADKLEGTAARLRQYQERGWPR
jgi:hypothetical protein